MSYKGGRPGFVRSSIIERSVPFFDGNSMFRSLGDILVDDHVALLFMDFEQPDRFGPRRRQLTIRPPVVDVGGHSGRGSGHGCTHVSQLPRFFHHVVLDRLSMFAPAPGRQPPEPIGRQWRNFATTCHAHPADT